MSHDERGSGHPDLAGSIRVALPLLFLAIGSISGWQLAWWENGLALDAAVAGRQVYAAVSTAAQRPSDAAPTAEAMPMVWESVDHLPAAPELAEDSLLSNSQQVIVEPEPPTEAAQAAEVPLLAPISSPEPLLAPISPTDPLLATLYLLDPRDRSIVPPSLVPIVEVVTVEEEAPAPVVARPPSPPPAQRLASLLSTYVIEPGDSLSELGVRFGVSVDTLRAVNDLDSDSLLIAGQPLLVPGDVSAAPRPTPPRPTPTPTVVARAVLPPPTPTPPPPTPTPRPAPQVARTSPPAPTSTPAARPTAPAPRPTSPAPTTVAKSAGAGSAALKIPGGPMVWPVNGTITQRFGSSHIGLDIAAASGTAVRAVAAGRVIVAARLDYGYGWRIIVDHGGGHTTLYSHLSSFSVEEGERVNRGQVIGAVGSTGQSTGPHLHFEVRVDGQPTDPLRYLP